MSEDTKSTTNYTITNISQAIRNSNRANISVNGVFRFSLDLYQLTNQNIKVGNVYTESELHNLEAESQFGKLYARTLEYCLMRPHSSREIKDYLWRKTRATKYKTRKGEIKDREGISTEVTGRVFQRLLDKGYIDDEKFARFWIEHRHLKKGSSIRKLQAELKAKGVERNIVNIVTNDTDRNDYDELQKVIDKKKNKYTDEQKLVAYLLRQGFQYDDIKKALTNDSENGL